MYNKQPEAIVAELTRKVERTTKWGQKWKMEFTTAGGDVEEIWKARNFTTDVYCEGDYFEIWHDGRKWNIVGLSNPYDAPDHRPKPKPNAKPRKKKEVTELHPKQRPTKYEVDRDLVGLHQDVTNAIERDLMYLAYAFDRAVELFEPHNLDTQSIRALATTAVIQALR